MKRRGFLTTAASVSAVPMTGLTARAAAPDEGAAAVARNGAPPSIPITGKPVPELAAFDHFMVGFMQRFGMPGGQCAVSKDGHIVYSRGFGYVDAQAPGGPEPPVVEPEALFRIASSTKPFTAVTILKLVEDGLLHLDDEAFSILHRLKPPPGMSPDPRLRSITVRQLLEHSGGFVNDPIDVQFDGLRLAADALHHPRPATNVDLVRYKMGQPLGFAPGTSYSYSNAGYNTLGRIIEQVTSLPYGVAVGELVLAPLGIRHMSLMTRTTPSYRLPNEVFYVDGLVLDSYSVYDDDPHVRAYAYGGFDGYAIDAHGGWIAHAADLVRFLDGVAGATGKQLLKPGTVATMLARPDNPFWRGKPKYYAMGWDVVPGSVVMGHNGAITLGTFSGVRRLPREITLAAVFNHLDPDIPTLIDAFSMGAIAAANSVMHWPTANFDRSA